MAIPLLIGGIASYYLFSVAIQGFQITLVVHESSWIYTVSVGHHSRTPSLKVVMKRNVFRLYTMVVFGMVLSREPTLHPIYFDMSNISIVKHKAGIFETTTFPDKFWYVFCIVKLNIFSWYPIISIAFVWTHQRCDSWWAWADKMDTDIVQKINQIVGWCT